MRRRVLLLSSVHIAVAAFIGGVAWSGGFFRIPGPLAVAFALGFGLVGLLPVHVEIGRHAISVTLVEAVLVAALLILGVPGVVLAAVVGEVVACLVQRQRLLKVLFNGTAALASTTVASVAATSTPVASRMLQIRVSEAATPSRGSSSLWSCSLPSCVNEYRMYAT